eukprot:4351679-Amphidinium_carterae.1
MGSATKTVSIHIALGTSILDVSIVAVVRQSAGGRWKAASLQQRIKIMMISVPCRGKRSRVIDFSPLTPFKN